MITKTVSRMIACDCVNGKGEKRDESNGDGEWRGREAEGAGVVWLWSGELLR